jgi:hypothetical protein
VVLVRCLSGGWRVRIGAPDSSRACRPRHARTTIGPFATTCNDGISRRCLLTANHFAASTATRRRTFGLTGRRRAKRDGNPKAQLLGAPVEPAVGQPSAKNHHHNSVRRAHEDGSCRHLVFDREAVDTAKSAGTLFSTPEAQTSSTTACPYHRSKAKPLTRASPRRCERPLFDTAAIFALGHHEAGSVAKIDHCCTTELERTAMARVRYHPVARWRALKRLH